jgi:hypothetical protein
MTGFLTSIVIVDRWPDVELTDLGGWAGAPEARGLISISEEPWPQAGGSRAMRAIILHRGSPLVDFSSSL